MSSVRDPAAVIQARVRKAKEVEASLVRGQPALPDAKGAGGDSRITKPASVQEVEGFIKAN